MPTIPTESEVQYRLFHNPSSHHRIIASLFASPHRNHPMHLFFRAGPSMRHLGKSPYPLHPISSLLTVLTSLPPTPKVGFPGLCQVTRPIFPLHEPRGREQGRSAHHTRVPAQKTPRAFRHTHTLSLSYMLRNVPVLPLESLAGKIPSTQDKKALQPPTRWLSFPLVLTLIEERETPRSTVTRSKRLCENMCPHPMACFAVSAGDVYPHVKVQRHDIVT
ncbi:hypothetical protein BO86DRAFT_124987 [Aspergillus japonicus CBS 114.51]|uniref:Uncharacterized protein n=2 Tax=Aspergillus TaxID=5052 RepID=A0A2V5HMT4_ASPV1|nr:hypothetical protein BO86DRAFT_124987 [Aspergillus japonicus CBS 114.51]PYI22833.1 hypothetical protein BO99DRAFT_239586 [Aspergillus violaceofuscus CBS 115571]RAH80618.1 hypothetical protein BO86DRAFT_124987 [Aspergillus japonicus CBS 114.51]